MIFALAVVAMVATSCSKSPMANNQSMSPKTFESVSAETPEGSADMASIGASNDEIVVAPTMVEVEKLAAKIEEKKAVEATSKTESKKMTAEEKEAIAETKAYVKNMSKEEKADFKKKAKDMLDDFKTMQKEGSSDISENTLLLVIIAILLPPLAVFLYEGAFTTRVLLSILLWLLFYLPGLIYALIVILG